MDNVEVQGIAVYILMVTIYLKYQYIKKMEQTNKLII